MPAPFAAVGGHVEKIFYGPTTEDGRTTLQKETTAWEVMYYIAMTWGAVVERHVTSLTMLTEDETREMSGFVKAVQGLRRFTPSFFSVRLPPAPWQPQTSEVAVSLAPFGGIDELREVHLQGGDLRLRDLWAPLFVELFRTSLALKGFSDEFDQPIWGIGLVDETSGMKEAAVMDVKLGVYRHSPFTPAAKVARMHRKEANTMIRVAGLRVCGFRRFRHESTPHEKEECGKDAGYVFATLQELSSGIRAFFSTQGRVFETADTSSGSSSLMLADRRRIRIDSATEKRLQATSKGVEDFVHFFEASEDGVYLLRHMAFVSTSLLFLYDAADEDASATFRLIDLARSGYRRLNYDENTLGFMQGLRNLVDCLREC